MNKKVSIEITSKSILLTILILFALWLLIILRGIVLLVFIAFSISAMIKPVISYLESKKIPRSLSIFVIYFSSFSILILLLILSYKPIVIQLEAFGASLPDITSTFLKTLIEEVPLLKENINTQDLTDQLETSFWANFEISSFSDYVVNGVSKAFGLVGSVFSALLNTITIIFLSIYFINLDRITKRKIFQIVPKKHHSRILKFFGNVESQVGAWLRAQLLLMLIIGVLSWFGFELIGMKFAIPMGIIGGLLEVIPNIGPTITWILAIIVGYGSGVTLWKIVFIAVWFIAIQQFENYIIVPKIMQKAVGANPAITIIAIISLSHPKIFGPIGTLIAVPLVAVAQITLQHYLEIRKENSK